MALGLHQLRDVAKTAGVSDNALAALAAATMMEESAGNPGAVGDRDDAGTPTSFGIAQVHEPDWPWIARATRAVMAAPFVSEYGRAVAEWKIALPIFQESTHAALTAAKVLRDRGFPVDMQDVLVIADAAWQGPGVVSWAHSTRTGNPDEIREGTSPGRAADIRFHLANLGIGSRSHQRWGWVAPVLIVSVAGLALWAGMTLVDRD